MATQQTTQSGGNGKLFSILSYIGILWLIGLLVAPEKDDPKVRFHVGQGIILTIFEVALGFVGGILGFILAFIPVLGVIVSLLISLAIAVVSIALIVIGILNVCKGKEQSLPVIGAFAFYK